ncbi:MAG: DUF5615 family PIN-like protein [Bacteroidetes bacterium]|nr:DUF5615 family PIN-like protein [Bacteroidota bacterium]
MRLLLDENIPHDIFIHLSGNNIPVRHIIKTKYAGSGDELIFNYSLRAKMTIVTYDKDFLDDRFINQTHYGIIFLQARTKDFKSIANTILAEVKRHRSLKNKVVIID